MRDAENLYKFHKAVNILYPSGPKRKTSCKNNI